MSEELSTSDVLFDNKLGQMVKTEIELLLTVQNVINTHSIGICRKIEASDISKPHLLIRIEV